MRKFGSDGRKDGDIVLFNAAEGDAWRPMLLAHLLSLGPDARRARHLLGAGVRRTIVVNRTLERARALAAYGRAAIAVDPEAVTAAHDPLREARLRSTAIVNAAAHAMSPRLSISITRLPMFSLVAPNRNACRYCFDLRMDTN